MIGRKTLLIASVHFGCTTISIAQGTVNPPSSAFSGGNPGPNFKTLQQVEPRTDLATVPGNANSMHRITQPGSYYLSNNLDVTTTDGIEINASGVTLDLNGFTIFRTSTASANGAAIEINASGLANIWIKNGHITGGVTFDPELTGDRFTGTGFFHAIIERGDPDPINVRVSQVHVSGTDFAAIDLNNSANTISSTVEHCSVRVAGGVGIRAGNIQHCSALDIQASAILALGSVSNCRGESVSLQSDGRGIDAQGQVSDSYGFAFNGIGIQSTSDVKDSIGESEIGRGIVASRNVSGSYGYSTSTSTSNHGISAANVTDSHGVATGGKGISATGNVLNCYGSSTSMDGIDSAGSVGNSFGQSGAEDGIEADMNISDSVGTTTGTGSNDHGVTGINVTDCHGVSEGGSGVRASGNVSGSTGVTSGTNDDSYGIFAEYNVSNSRGGGSGGGGILSSGGNIDNCVGAATKSDTDANGISASVGSIRGSYGTAVDGRGLLGNSISDSRGGSQTNEGIRGTTVLNCFGSTSTGSAGIFAFGTAANCRGHFTSGIGVAIDASIASACTVVGSDTITATTKVDGTP